MSAWYGSSDEYTFFAQDARTRQNYKDWVRHVVSRSNTINGRRYVDDPTMLSWELMNEPDIHPAPLLRDWLVRLASRNWTPVISSRWGTPAWPGR